LPKVLTQSLVHSCRAGSRIAAPYLTCFDGVTPSMCIRRAAYCASTPRPVKRVRHQSPSAKAALSTHQSLNSQMVASFSFSSRVSEGKIPPHVHQVKPRAFDRFALQLKLPVVMARNLRSTLGLASLRPSLRAASATLTSFSTVRNGCCMSREAQVSTPTRHRRCRAASYIKALFQTSSAEFHPVSACQTARWQHMCTQTSGRRPRFVEQRLRREQLESRRFKRCSLLNRWAWAHMPRARVLR